MQRVKRYGSGYELERAVLFGLVEPPRRSRPSPARGLLAVLAALLTVLGAPVSAALADTFLVSNDQDSGKGSLRQAMLDSNAAAQRGVANTITVDAGVGPLTVYPRTPLPVIDGVLLLDGQGKLAVNDTFTKGNGLWLGAASGSDTFTRLTVLGASAAGIRVDSSGNLIAGTTVGDTFARNGMGIFLGAGNNTIGGAAAGMANTIGASVGNGLLIGLSSADRGGGMNLIEGNFIGTDATGDSGFGNGAAGVAVAAGQDGDNTIGGTAAGAGNVISGNGGAGVLLSGAAGNVVEGNLIGLAPSGSAALPNRVGVRIAAGATGNVVGGGPGAQNVVSGNGGPGIVLSGQGTSGNAIERNYVGTQADHKSALGNRGDGIWVFGGATMNTIGGAPSGLGNAVAFNGGGGVHVDGSSTTGEAILRNSIFANGRSASGPGISLTSGANGMEPAPVIGSVTVSSAGTTVAGKGAPRSRIEVFLDRSCADPEGQRFMAAATSTADGNWKVTLSSTSPSQAFTADQTDARTLDTSPFSGCVAASA